MQQWMLTFVNQFGYLGIFLLILIENIFPSPPLLQGRYRPTGTV